MIIRQAQYGSQLRPVALPCALAYASLSFYIMHRHQFISLVLFQHALNHRIAQNFSCRCCIGVGAPLVSDPDISFFFLSGKNLLAVYIHYYLVESHELFSSQTCTNRTRLNVLFA